jgi:hypothetical protein
MLCVKRLIAAAVCSLTAVAASAQTSPVTEPAVPEKEGKQLQAYRISGTPPRIDGRIDDEVWTRAQAIDDLVQDEPRNLEAPTERTTVQIAFDNDNIYMAARCFMNDPSQIRIGARAARYVSSG